MALPDEIARILHSASTVKDRRIAAILQELTDDMTAADALENDLMSTVLVRMDKTWTALAEVIRLAADDGCVVALEYLADYMNSCDATEPEDAVNYERWRARAEEERYV